MAELSEDIQTFIVQSLACYQRPAQVIDAVKAEFNLDVTRQQVQFYNPERGGGGKRLSDRWRNLFHETRRQFDRNVAALPVNKLSYRLTRLQRMSEKAEDNGDFTLAADLLKQAAQDLGGLFTNQRKVEVSDPRRALADLLGVSEDLLPDDLTPDTIH